MYVITWSVVFAALWPFYSHFGFRLGIQLGVPFFCAYVVSLYVLNRSRQ